MAAGRERGARSRQAALDRATRAMPAPISRRISRSRRSGRAPARARRQHGDLGAALKKIADAADPLYKTLDDGQKHRLVMLTQSTAGSAAAGGTRGFEHGMDGRRPGPARPRPDGIRRRIGMDRWRPRTIRGGSEPRDAFEAASPPGKPPESGGFSRFARRSQAGKTPQACWTSRGRFAKRRPLARLSRAGSGRIAQLVEQLTLNQRVPGSSPGAPTTQSPQTAASETTPNTVVSAGISDHQFPDFCLCSGTADHLTILGACLCLQKFRSGGCCARVRSWTALDPEFRL